jgi:hypothetical protein
VSAKKKDGDDSTLDRSDFALIDRPIYFSCLFAAGAPLQININPERSASFVPKPME